MIILSKMLIKKNIKSSTINLKIRNCVTGPQGILNIAFNKKP